MATSFVISRIPTTVKGELEQHINRQLFYFIRLLPQWAKQRPFALFRYQEEINVSRETIVFAFLIDRDCTHNY